MLEFLGQQGLPRHQRDGLAIVLTYILFQPLLGPEVITEPLDAGEFEERGIRIPLSEGLLQHVGILLDRPWVPAVPEDERPEDVLPVIGDPLHQDVLVDLGCEAVVSLIKICMTAFFQPVAVFLQEFGFPGQVVAGVEESQDRLVKGFDILLELCVKAVPELPVAGRRDIDIGVSSPVEVPGETLFGGNSLDLLKDVQRLLRPVGLSSGFEVLPELANLGIVTCVVRVILFHCYRSCE